MVLSSRRVCVHARCRGQTYLGRAAPSTLGDAKPVHDAEFEQLITAFPPDSYASRARSASDAGVLRRKGRLKEQDQLIDFIVSMHQTHTCEETMVKLERWVQEHRRDPKRSKLKRLVPNIGQFFTDLPLLSAFREYDKHFSISRRRYVRPNFAEIRHILNIAQVHASAQSLRLITFDADGTLYADGCHMEQDNKMIDAVIELLEKRVHVAIVTAAGYPNRPELFQRRIPGLLTAFQKRKLSKDVTDRFLLLGGECNYLLGYDHDASELTFIPDEVWKTPEMLSWRESDIKHVLDRAQAALEDAAVSLRLKYEVVRKERAVGIIPKSTTLYEVLEDLTITVDRQLLDEPVPFCAFNGGGDVFVDIGNKNLGLHALKKYLGTRAHQTLHVGDRFTASGNDNATRDCCSILWVAAPEETGFFVDMLLDDIESLMSNACME